MVRLHLYQKLEQGRIDLWVIAGKHNFKLTIAFPFWVWR